MTLKHWGIVSYLYGIIMASKHKGVRRNDNIKTPGCSNVGVRRNTDFITPGCGAKLVI